MITIHFDRSEGAPSLYTQLYESIKQMIIMKQLPAGEMLPSKRALASHLQVSIKTVENAYFQLQLEGFIVSKEKVGYFVANLEGFYVGKPSSKPYVTKYREDEFALDIKANKSDPEMFPMSVWARMARDVLTEQDRKLLDTVPFNGVAELRIAIAEYLRGFRGMTVSPDQIVVGSGTEYLYGRITQLLGPDCVIGMDDPGYSHIKTILSNDKVEFRSIAMDESGMRPDLLAQSDCTAVHLSPMHQFPLGGIMPVQRRVELLKWVNAAPDRYIIEDDYNCEFLYQGSPVPPLFQMDVRKKVIYMNTFSKTVAPSVRLAYMVLPEALMDRYIETMSFYSCTVSSMTQYQLAKFISQGHLERYIHRVRQFNLGQRKLVMDSVENSNLSRKVKVLRNPVGTHFVLRLNTKVSDAEMKKAFLGRGVLASFVSEYCEAADPSKEHLLILNYSRIEQSGMDRLLEILGELI